MISFGFSDLADLWVIEIKKASDPLGIMSRSREQSTKRRSCRENMRNVCLSYSQNNKIV